MFSSHSSRAAENDSQFAHLQNTMSGKLLTVRISLQQVIDEANKFPVLENSRDSSSDNCLDESNPFRDGLYTILGDMVDMLKQQVPGADDDTSSSSSSSSSSGKKRRRSGEEESSGVLGWEQVVAPQQQLQGDWEAVMNREHARSHFGSEQKKSKLKVFNNSIWDQVQYRRDRTEESQHWSTGTFVMLCYVSCWQLHFVV
jgi:hypothetical protein